MATRSDGGEAELSVANTGPVVPAYDLEAISEPFRRLRTDRVRSDRGTGLACPSCVPRPRPTRARW